MAVVRRANGALRLKKRISVLLKCEGDDADELVSQKRRPRECERDPDKHNRWRPDPVK